MTSDGGPRVVLADITNRSLARHQKAASDAAAGVKSVVQPVMPQPLALPPPPPPQTATASINPWAAHLLGTNASVASMTISVAAPTSAVSLPQSDASTVVAAATSTASRLISAGVALEEYNPLILEHILENEMKYLPNPSYMECVQSDLSHVMRSILMDWLIEISEEYALCSQTLFLCVNYVDRFLSVYPVDRAKLQLLGVSSLLLAAKYWEVRAPSIDEFIYISDATYSREQVLAMEGALLNTLQFALMAVTPWDCSTRISHRMGRDILPERTEFLAEVRRTPTHLAAHAPFAGLLCRTRAHAHSCTLLLSSQMMMELFILEPHYLQYRPSVIAVSALFLSLYTTHANPWPAELESACGLTVDSIQLCVRAMHAAYLRMVQNPAGFIAGAGVPPLVAIKEKYAQARFFGVADIQPRLL